MADFIDQAQECLEVHLEKALSHRTVYQGESLWFCEECNQSIPEGRRKAIPGVKKCTICQTIEEIRARLHLTPKHLRKGY